MLIRAQLLTSTQFAQVNLSDFSPPRERSELPGMENRDTRRRFEQWGKNPGCEANAVSAILGVSMVEVAEREGLTSTMGQSPFALQRGQRFERQLFGNGAELLRTELENAAVLPKGSQGFADFRMRLHGGSCANLNDARERTRELLSGLAEEGVTSKTPTIVAGATICVPGRAMLPEAILVLDAIVLKRKENQAEIVVGEIKTYPDRGGYTDGVELAGARAQSGVYVHGLQEVIEENRWTSIEVSKTGFLVLTKPGSNQPSIRAREDLHYQAVRAKRGLEKLRALAGQMVQSESALKDPVGAVLAAGVNYEESCVRFCDRASGCFARAVQSGHPAILGDDVARLTGTISLDRVRELLHGAKPQTQAERELVNLAGVA